MKLFNARASINIDFVAIENVHEIETVIQELGADFVVGAINRALRDRARLNRMAGVDDDLLPALNRQR